jgi:NAD(P)-dependent dehydrogenase (short-subunit alcohol dehydrogenase family)
VAGLEEPVSDGRFRGQVALITGASSGIGRAVALEYARLGGSVCLSGRSVERLEEVARMARQFSVEATVSPGDLSREDDLRRLSERVRTQAQRLDLLVHAAGLYQAGRVAEVHAADLDALYAANVRAPYFLTREMLPALRLSRGQIVFVNSTVVFGSEPGLAAYSLTKHALRALADHLRAEVNEEGIRVLSVFPGRTATPLQERIHAAENKPYDTARLLRPEDVAATVIDAVSLPRNAEVTEVRIRPSVKS